MYMLKELCYIPYSFYYCFYTYYTNNIGSLYYLVLGHIISGVHKELYLCGGSGHPGHLLLAPPSRLYDRANIYNIEIVKIF